MTELPQRVLSWLHNVLLSQEYHDVNRTFSDVAQTLSQQSTLRPQTNVYRAFENGHSALLLHLAGTIPVQFRGAPYSFPVSLWVPHAYPREGPIAFVTPTREMAVRPGQHVSGEGRIYHPYLANWRPDRSNLDEFLRILQDVFSREPPVISKQDSAARPSSLSFVNDGDSTMPALPPKPGQLSPAKESSKLYSSPSGQPPPPPPKTFQNNDDQNLSRQSKPPPVPPHPSLMSEQRRPSSEAYKSTYTQSSQQYQPAKQYAPQRQSSLRNEHYISAQPEQVRPPSMLYGQRPGLLTSQQMPALTSPFSPIQDPAIQQRYQQPLLPPVPGAVNPPSATYIQRPQPHQLYSQPPNPNKYPPYKTYSHAPPAPKPPPPADLLSSPLDIPLPTQSQPSDIPAPPIPPNPQKDALLRTLSRTLTQTLHDNLAHNTSLLPPLRAQQQALQSALASLQQEHQSLTALSDLLSSNESILHKAMRDADNVIAEAKHRTVPPVDEVLVAPTVVGEQLYELVAEERACVEARGVLARALDRGRVGVEVWVRVNRGVAREEFLKKALVRKCASGLGLRVGEEW